MKRKVIPLIALLIFAVVGTIFTGTNKQKDNSKNTNELEAIVVSIEENRITLVDVNDIFYTLGIDNFKGNLGDGIILEYTGVLDRNSNIQDIEVVDYSLKTTTYDDILSKTGIFSDYYEMASRKLKELSLDEKIGQLILGRYPDNNAKEDIEKYKLSGFVFFEKDFKNKDKSQVKEMINEVQKSANIPLLTAVDEEGGKIVRVSSNPSLVAERFQSPSELYKLGGLDAIKKDTQKKSNVLKDLGINLNLAPVVDVTTNSSDYMYERTLQENTEKTAEYAKTVISTSIGSGVSYTLKHFPGYGNNADTHDSSSLDNRSYESILANDIPPFTAGIEAGAEAVLVSHNTVSAIDPDNPASLSPSVHNLLRNELDFSGVIITDDLAMGAVSSIDDAVVKAIMAGNNLIITTDYKSSIAAIKSGLNNGTISEEMIDKLAFRVLAWKYYKGLMLDEK